MATEPITKPVKRRRPGAGHPFTPRPVVNPADVAASAGVAPADLARLHAALAIETLVAIATQSRNDAARVLAAKALLERGFGKPTPPAPAKRELTENEANWAELLGEPKAH